MTNPSTLHPLHFRCIGPPRGGRVVAVAGHPTDRNIFYFGACAGGVWKTIDGGTYWENISDGFFGSSAVGAMAVSESDPNVIYVGMGESSIRGDVSWGDGVYRSTDGGRTWAHAGLRDSHHIGAIRIHPHNPDLVYVAVLGHAFGPNPERGVYRSADGGKHWARVLHVSEQAGAVDLSLDPTNPRNLYATVWQVHRYFWELISGGEESGLWISTDGGDSWRDITRNRGLPRDGILGKIGVTASPAQPGRVWAIVEAEGDASGVYRSDDFGESWDHLTDNQDLLARPWYYMHIFADPQDPETVYVNNLKMWKSVDGGTRWSEITTPHGDNHALWIDPADPQRMINGNDGGACVSFNGGESWSTIYNQLTGQFYRMDVDDQLPYRVYGTQQDNSSISVPSATEKGAITWNDCYPAGTGESGFIAVKPDDPNIVYVGAVGSSPGGGGALQRYDHRTKQIHLVTVWPETYFGWGAGDMKFRFPWTFPIHFSPHDTGVLYACGNQVFRSTDEGQSWQVLSPDLTRNDATKLGPSGGSLTLDTSGAEHYCTLSTFFESPHEPETFWAGSDDGLVHLSRDGGGTWQDVTPPDLPEWSYINVLEQSAHDPATVYLSATRYKLDDYGAYLFKTSDYGQSWTCLDASFPQGEITRMLREDPQQPGLLYVGTERGLYVSWDDGANWSPMPGDLPVVPVYDFKIKGDELVVATHGRAFWILDDLTPVRHYATQWAQRESGTGSQVGEAGASASSVRASHPLHVVQATLFPPKPALRRWQPWIPGTFRGPGRKYAMAFGALITYKEEETDEGQVVRRMIDSGENPPQGAIIYYALPEGAEEISLTILDGDGVEIRTFTSKPEKPHKPENKVEMHQASAVSGSVEKIYLTTNPGINRFIWDLRYPEPEQLEGDPVVGDAEIGAWAVPGTYTARLQLGEQQLAQSFQVTVDPRTGASQADLQQQFHLLQAINSKIDSTHRAIKQIRRVRRQVEQWKEQLEQVDVDPQKRDATVARAADLAKQLTQVEDALVQTGTKTAFDRLRLPTQLNAKLVGLVPVVAGADAAPTRQAQGVFQELSDEVDQQLEILASVLDEGVADFNAALADLGIGTVVV